MGAREGGIVYRVWKGGWEQGIEHVVWGILWVGVMIDYTMIWGTGLGRGGIEWDEHVLGVCTYCR